MPFIFLNHEKLEQTENKIIIWDESYETNFGIKQLPYDYGKTMRCSVSFQKDIFAPASKD